MERIFCSYGSIPVPIYNGNENAVEVKPILVYKDQYMMKTETGGLRQPVFKGLQLNKALHECIEKNDSLMPIKRLAVSIYLEQAHCTRKEKP